MSGLQLLQLTTPSLHTKINLLKISFYIKTTFTFEMFHTANNKSMLLCLLNATVPYILPLLTQCKIESMCLLVGGYHLRHKTSADLMEVKELRQSLVV